MVMFVFELFYRKRVFHEQHTLRFMNFILCHVRNGSPAKAKKKHQHKNHKHKKVSLLLSVDGPGPFLYSSRRTKELSPFSYNSLIKHKSG